MIWEYPYQKHWQLIKSCHIAEWHKCCSLFTIFFPCANFPLSWTQVLPSTTFQNIKQFCLHYTYIWSLNMPISIITCKNFSRCRRNHSASSISIYICNRHSCWGLTCIRCPSFRIKCPAEFAVYPYFWSGRVITCPTLWRYTVCIVMIVNNNKYHTTMLVSQNVSSAKYYKIWH